jgi:hypothetical protein
MAGRAVFQMDQATLENQVILGYYRKHRQDTKSSHCLVAIIGADLKIERSTYEILQVVDISLLDKTPVNELFTNTDCKNSKDLFCSQQFDFFPSFDAGWIASNENFLCACVVKQEMGGRLNVGLPISLNSELLTWHKVNCRIFVPHHPCSFRTKIMWSKKKLSKDLGHFPSGSVLLM